MSWWHWWWCGHYGTTHLSPFIACIVVWRQGWLADCCSIMIYSDLKGWIGNRKEDEAGIVPGMAGWAKEGMVSRLLWTNYRLMINLFWPTSQGTAHYGNKPAIYWTFCKANLSQITIVSANIPVFNSYGYFYRFRVHSIFHVKCALTLIFVKPNLNRKHAVWLNRAKAILQWTRPCLLICPEHDVCFSIRHKNRSRKFTFLMSDIGTCWSYLMGLCIVA